MITLVLIMCLFVSTAGATDMDEINDDLTSDDVNVTVLQDDSSNADVLSATGSFTDLNTAISGKTTVSLTQNYTYQSGDTAYKEGIKITQDNVVINGNGYTIDANNMARIFNITGNNVVLNNIILKNALITNSLNHNAVNYTNVNFTFGNGAGIIWTGSNGVLNNSIITNNKIQNTITFYNTTDSNVEYIIGNGAGIYWTGSNAIIENTIIENNTIVNNIVYKYNYWFYPNKNIVRIVGSGAGIYLTGSDSSILGSKFRKNSINGVFDYLDDGSIVNNEPVSQGMYQFFIQGGALRLTGNNVNLTSSVFEDNNAGYGGAVYLSGNKNNIIRSNFSGNNASISGGAVSVYNPSNNTAYSVCINESNFNFNDARTLGGALSLDFRNSRIYNSNFTNNSANNRGGAIIWNCNNGIVNNSVFKGNKGSVDAGAIFFDSDSSNNIIDSSVFIENKAITGSGGALGYFYANGNNYIYNSNFTNNSAVSSNDIARCTNTVIANNTFRGVYAEINNKIIKDKGGEYFTLKATSDEVDVNINIYVDGVYFDSDYMASKSGNKKIYLSNLGVGVHNLTLEFTGGDNTYINTVSNFEILVGDVVLYVEVGGDGDGSSANPSSWSYALENIPSGGTIILNGGTYSEIVNQYIGKIISIKGSGNTILDLQQKGKAFTISANNVTIENIKVINGYSDRSSAAISWSGSFGRMVNCSFINNTAACNYRDTGGGAMNGFGYGMMINCSFINNTALSIGILSGYAGAMAVGSNVTVIGCVFRCNSANAPDVHGGAIYSNAQNLTFINSLFEDNSAKAGGGAIGGNSLYMKIINCTFNNNSANGDGGAVYVYQVYVNISNSIFTNNSAKGSGGAIYWGGDNGYLFNCTFAENTAPTGGAVYWGGTNGVIANSIFTKNSVSGSGGAVYWSGTGGKVYDSQFNNNSARVSNDIYRQTTLIVANNDFNGFYIDANSTVTVSYPYLNMKVTSDEGDMTVEVIVDDSLFDSISIPAKNIGNTLIDLSNLTTGEYTITLNFSNGSNRYSNYKTKLVLLNDMVFYVSVNGKGNGSSDNPCNWSYALENVPQGGTIVLGNGVFNIAGQSITKNNLVIRGSGNTIIDAKGYNNRIFSISGSNVILNRISFINGYAPNTSNAGAISWGGANGTMINCNFINNTATNEGGAVIWGSINGNIINCNFINNTARGSLGGGLYITSAAPNTVVSGCTFVNNHAGNGGAVGVWTSAHYVNISNSNFINNTARSNGGAIYWNSNYGNLISSNFTDNTARSHGGAVYWYGSNGNIISSIFTGNNATYFGGAIRWDGGSGNLTSSNFTDNSASCSGGAIRWDGSNGKVEDSNFINSNALGMATDPSGHVGRGGAILSTNSNFKVYNSNFTSTASGGGGALALWGANAYVNNSIFKYGESIVGAAIYWNGAGGIVNNSVFVNNSASSRSHDIYFGSNNVTIVNSNFTGTYIDTPNVMRSYPFVNVKVTSDNRNMNVNLMVNNRVNKTFTVLANSSGNTLLDLSNLGKGSYTVTLSFTNSTNRYYNNPISLNVVDDMTLYVSVNGKGDGSQSNPTNLTYALDNVPRGGTIILQNGTYNLAGLILSKPNVNIRGVNNVILDASGLQGTILNILSDANNVSLKNIVFKNGYSQSTAAALLWSAVNGTMVNCTFINNTCGVGGAASFSTNTTVINSSFINNTANGTNGGYGGAISVNGPTLFMGCNFTGNRATSTSYGGGVMYCNGNNVSFVNSIFRDNSAPHGGVLRFNGINGTVINCSFINNTASSHGGAIIFASWGSNSYGGIYNSRFINNSASSYGGAVVIEKSGIVIYNSTFTNNSANIHSGAIYWSGDNGNIYNSNFTNNKVTGSTAHSGAIYWRNSNGRIYNSSFVNNSASRGGAIWWDGSNGRVYDSNFTNNKATGAMGGGAIRWAGSNGLVNNSRFINNTALVSNDIYRSSTTTISYCNFSGDYINIDSIFLNSDNFTIKSTSSNNNLSVSVLIDGSVNKNIIVEGKSVGDTSVTLSGLSYGSHTISLRYSTVDNNVYTNLVNKTFQVSGYDLLYVSPAGKGNGSRDSPTNWTYALEFINVRGTIVLLEGTYKNIINQVISKPMTINGSGNTTIDAQGRGRVFSVSGDNVTLNNLIFTGGSVTGNGASILWTGSNGKLNKSSFIANSASGNGTVWWNGTNGLITSCNFTNNSAGRLPDVYRGSDDLTISGCRFVGDYIAFSSSDFNGYLNVEVTSDEVDLTVYVTVDGNINKGVSVDAKSAVDLCDVALSVLDAGSHSISLQFVPSGSGNVYTQNVVHSVDVVDMSVLYVSPYLSGSGLSVSDPCSWDYAISNIPVGGTIVLLNGSFGIAGKTISKSNIRVNGSGSTVLDAKGFNNRVLTISGVNVTLYNVKISNGYVSNSGTWTSGAGIQWSGVNGTVINCTFSNNSIYGSSIVSGALSISYGTVINCTFINNYAQTYGGAMECSYSMIINCSFINNSASSSSWGAGAVMCPSGSTFINCNFTGNKAPCGGAVSIDNSVHSGVNVSFDNCYFADNVATSGVGGAIWWANDYGNLTNCVFVNNSASSQGGAVYWSGSNPYDLVNLKFYNNTATTGSALWTNKNMNIKNSVFLDNNDKSSFSFSNTSNSVIVSYNGNDNYLCGIYDSGTVSFTNVSYWNNGLISKSNSVSKSANGNYSVVVEFYDKNTGVLLKNTSGFTNSSGMFSVSSLASNDYRVVAYHKTGGSASVSGEFNFTVAGKNHVEMTVIVVSDNTIVNGSNISIYAFVGSGVSGNVTFVVDGSSFVRSVSGGCAVLDYVVDLVPGLYEVSAVYGGNNNYYSNSSVSSFRVNYVVSPFVVVSANSIVEVLDSVYFVASSNFMINTTMNKFELVELKTLEIHYTSEVL